MDDVGPDVVRERHGGRNGETGNDGEDGGEGDSGDKGEQEFAAEALRQQRSAHIDPAVSGDVIAADDSGSAEAEKRG